MQGLQIYDQSVALFHNDVAYYDWHGVSLDRAEHTLIAEAVKGGSVSFIVNLLPLDIVKIRN